MYVTLHRMCSNIVVHTLYIAVSVIHKFHSLSIATVQQSDELMCRQDWLFPLPDITHGVGFYSILALFSHMLTVPILDSPYLRLQLLLNNNLVAAITISI